MTAKQAKTRRNCVTCGTVLPLGMRADALFCDLQCKRVARREDERQHRAKQLSGRTCVVCSAPVPSSARSDAKYCSEECRSIVRRRNHPSPPSSPSTNALATLKRGGMLHPPRTSPYRVLARTCPGCEDLLITPIHLVLKSAGPLPRCRRCSVSQVTANRNRRQRVDPEFRRKLRRRTDRLRKRMNDALNDAAVNHGKQWTGPELEILCREDLTHRQAAEALGRTLYAVRHQRQLLRVDPRKINLAGQVPHPT